MRKISLSVFAFGALFAVGGLCAQDDTLSNPLDLAGADNILFLPQAVRQEAFASVRLLSPTRTI
ncbi:hypothetical protein N9O33_08460, partial [Gammaproteobacteria bacterium]|nr:hypothetical protein [Gammaproteobacteria bacterium]